MRAYTIALVALATALSTSGCIVHAHSGPPGRQVAPGGWEKLGERLVNGKADHDTVIVGRAEGHFSSIMLRVEHSSIEMHDVLITFGDGSTYSPPTRLVFRPNETSREIDLPGDRRVIRKVEFKYSNLPGGGSASVEVWGR